MSTYWYLLTVRSVWSSGVIGPRTDDGSGIGFRPALWAACRARTGGQAATSWAVGRSIRPAALAVSERSWGPFERDAAAPPSPSAALCWPIPRQRVQPRVSRGWMRGLQLPQLHASVLESPGGGGRRLSSAQCVRRRASVGGNQGRTDGFRSPPPKALSHGTPVSVGTALLVFVRRIQDASIAALG